MIPRYKWLSDSSQDQVLSHATASGQGGAESLIIRRRVEQEVQFPVWRCFTSVFKQFSGSSVLDMLAWRKMTKQQADELPWI